MRDENKTKSSARTFAYLCEEFWFEQQRSWESLREEFPDVRIGLVMVILKISSVSINNEIWM